MKAHLPVRRTLSEQRNYEPPAEGRSKKLRLDFNENTAGCSPAVARALAKLTPQQMAMYPEYEVATRRLAKYFGVRSEELLLTNGGDDALRVFFDAFVDAGSSIVLCEPTFPMYRFFANIAGACVVAVRYGPNMEFPMDAVLATLKKKPRVLFLANPNNPTGTLLGYNELEKIVKAATHTAVVIDEAYADFSGLTVVPWLKTYPHLFVTRTFSKATGLAGLRLGAVMASARSLEILRRAMPPYPVNIAALVAAEAAVRDRKTLQAYARNVQRLRGWFEEELKRLGIRTYPSAANFLLADFGSAGPVLFERLHAKGILVRERSKDFQPGFVRITIGTEPEMKTLVREIRKHWRAN
jgi:histidinol-phosphate aminotransferase